MKFDINIDYTIDLDKCNAQALDSSKDSNFSKALNPILPDVLKKKKEEESCEKKIKKFQLNFLDNKKVLIFISSKKEMQEFEDIRKSCNFFEKVEGNEYEFNCLEQDRRQFFEFLLEKFIDDNHSVRKIYACTYIFTIELSPSPYDSNLRDQNQINALNTFIDKFQNEFIRLDTFKDCPFFIEWSNEHDKSSVKVYSETLSFCAKKLEFANLFCIVDYLIQVTDERFKAHLWTKYPFNNIIFTKHEKEDHVYIEMQGIFIEESFKWVIENYIGVTVTAQLDMSYTDINIDDSLLRNVVTQIASSSEIEYYGLSDDVRQIVELINK